MLVAYAKGNREGVSGVERLRFLIFPQFGWSSARLLLRQTNWHAVCLEWAAMAGCRKDMAGRVVTQQLEGYHHPTQNKPLKGGRRDHEGEDSGQGRWPCSSTQQDASMRQEEVKYHPSERQTLESVTTFSNPKQAVKSIGGEIMKTKTKVKAGGIQHNETQVRDPKGLGVKTQIKSGQLSVNHNETLVRNQVR